MSMEESQEAAGPLVADHGKPQHEYTIWVNGRQKVVDHREMGFAEVVTLAFETPPSGPSVIITVTYSHASGPRPNGTLVEGETVKIKDGTIFNVTATDKS